MNEFLSRSIDAKLAHQSEQMQREQKLYKKERFPCITISREFGCEGYPLALALAEKLGGAENLWTIFGRDDILELAANDEKTKLQWDTIPDEARTTFTQYLDAIFSNRPTDFALYKQMAKNIKAISVSGRSIIVGAAAAALIQNQKNVFHFRLVASEAFRVKRIIAMGYSEQEAKILFREKDEQRIRFVKEFTGKNLSDPHLYAITFNNTLMQADEIAENIVHFIKNHKI